MDSQEFIKTVELANDAGFYAGAIVGIIAAWVINEILANLVNPFLRIALCAASAKRVNECQKRLSLDDQCICAECMEKPRRGVDL